MSLGYDISQALPGLRAEAESRMDDLIKAVRAGVKEWDEDAGAWVATEVVIYEGKARVKRSNVVSVASNAGSQLTTVDRLQVHVPVGSPPFSINDLIEVTASASRPEQVGRRYKIAAMFDGSQTTALRYAVEVADGR